jgi:hypothetical protein
MKLQNAETFSFHVATLPKDPTDTTQFDFIWSRDDLDQLKHLKLSTPYELKLQITFTNDDAHYGIHQAKIKYRTFDSVCQHTGRLTTAYLIEEFMSNTLDTSSLLEDLQSNFIGKVEEDLYFFMIDLVD